jgi:hypothetical protein
MSKECLASAKYRTLEIAQRVCPFCRSGMARAGFEKRLHGWNSPEALENVVCKMDDRK